MAPWWSKITPDYYKKPSGLGAAVMPRARQMAAVYHDTRLGDQPEIAAAFLNANVPYSVAQRADIKTRIAKAQATQAILAAGGVPDQADKVTKRIVETEKKQYQITAMRRYLEENASGLLPAAFDTVQEGSRSSVKGLGSALNAAYSVLTVPAALWRANQGPADNAVGKVATTGLRAVNESEREGYGPFQFMPDINNLVADLAGVAIPGALGVGRYLGAVPLTGTQQEDMTKQGYDPNDFFSRYAWYYDGQQAGQRAVADQDVASFSKEYGAESAQAVREILTSNALNEGKFEGLSPNAQAFIAKVQTGDQRANEVFERMSKSATLHPGSVIADVFQMERGTTSAAVVSVLGDLALYWMADPVMLGVKAASFGRALHRSVPAGDIAAGEAKLLALKVPGEIGSGPATYAGSAIDEVIDVADMMNIAEFGAKGLSREQAINFEKALTNKIDRFRIRHPDLMNQLGPVANILSGKLDFMYVKSQAEIELAATRLSRGEKVDPYLRVNLGGAKTSRALARDLDGKASQASLDMARGEIVKRLSTYIWGEAIATGRPIIKGRVLMPGEVMINRAVRGAIAPYRNALLGRGTLKQAWDQTNGLVVHFSGDFGRATDNFIGSRAGDWTKVHYTTKWGPTFEKIVSRFDMTFSNKHLSWSGADGTEVFRRFAITYFPRHMAYVALTKWATGGPNERKALWEQFAEGMAQAANFKSNPIAAAVTDVLTKGALPRLLAGQNGNYARSGPNEAYAANAADNTIKAGNDDLAAGIWGYQMADGVTLPSMRLINAYQKRVGLLSAITGFFNSRMISTLTAIWKVGKVGNPANMFRQTAELYAMAAGEQGLKFLREVRRARKFVLAENLTAKAGSHDLSRAANKVHDNAYVQDIRALETFAKRGDWFTYRQTIARMALANGANQREAQALANLADGVKFEDLVKAGAGGRAGLALAGPIDMFRRARVEWLKRTGGKTPSSSTWEVWISKDFQQNVQAGSVSDLGDAASSALQLGSARNAATDMASVAARSIGGRRPIIPNSRDWMGAAGDSGAQNWFRELDARMTDPAGGGDVLRAVAIEARQTGSASAAQVLNQPHNMAARGVTHSYPPGVNTAEEIAEYIIRHDPRGELLRTNAMRLAYENGSRVTTAAQLDTAVGELVQVQLREAARHLGGRFDNASGKFVYDAAYGPNLDKIAKGGHLRLEDLSKIKSNLRPESLSTPIFVPRLVEPSKEKIADMASKLYGFTVAHPLQRLAINPTYIANRTIAYRELAPAADALIARGLKPEQAGAFLELQANRYAVNTTFRYTDNSFEQSFFSELTDNFLMFQRAAEDFIRRFMMVTKANPAILSKAYLLMEAAQHSGVIYPNADKDGEGNPDPHLVFTFPGSGIMAQAIAEGGRALGFGDTDLIKTALYSSMSSQLRFINPSLSNPFGFSTTPMIGMPMRIVRSWFPETYRPITETLARIEGGGEEFFAEQNVVQSILPTPLARLLPAITQNDQDGQLASAIRNALVYFTASGNMPGPDATADEIEEANDAVRTQATNQIIWRAIIGSFSPWSPAYNAPLGLDLPEVNAVDQARGINSLRSEWFEILSQQSEKYAGYEGFAHALTEWGTRYPHGKSILNPEAFVVGTTRAPGTAEGAGSFNSGPRLTEWLMANKEWVRSNAAVAYYLLPQFAEDNFSAAGMREQLINEVREHKDSTEFYRDLRQRVGEREWWDRYKQRNAELARGNRPATAVYRDFSEWEAGWRTAHPATAAEMDRKQDPNTTHSVVAPALGRLVESGQAPADVNLDLARQVWEHYREYRDRYNKTVTGDKGLYDRRGLNKKYREDGDQLFLGTPAEELWNAMNVYEGD
jgi:hypothetical protein